MAKSEKKDPGHYPLPKTEPTVALMEEINRLVLERTGLKVTATAIMRRGIELYLLELRGKSKA